MKKVFYLKTCSTWMKILKEFDLSDWELREIKTEPITADELDAMRALSGSYEALFSKKSTQIKQRAIEAGKLSENDFRALLLEHYTFLKRPVIQTDKDIFIGNSKENIARLKAYFA